MRTSYRAYRRLYEKTRFHEWTGRARRLVCTVIWNRCRRAIRVTRASNTLTQHLLQHARVELGNLSIRVDVPVGNRRGKVVVEGERLVDDRVGYRRGSSFFGILEGRGAERDDQGRVCERQRQFLDDG